MDTIACAFVANLGGDLTRLSGGFTGLWAGRAHRAGTPEASRRLLLCKDASAGFWRRGIVDPVHFHRQLAAPTGDNL